MNSLELKIPPVILVFIIAAIMLPVYVWFLTRFQIIPEERILLDNFGKPYADYLQTVRRWI